MAKKQKFKILVFIDWFYPAYKAGGPVKSVYNLVQALQADFQFSIVTSNLDVDKEVLDVKCNEWTTFQGINVIYLSQQEQSKKTYRRIYDELNPNSIYYNSLFSKQFTLQPYKALKHFNCNQIIAPRGMLGKGALAIKAFKKKVFLNLSKQLFFNMKKTMWHATSAQEAEEIKAAYGKKSNIQIAKNISSARVERKDVKKEKGKLRLVFVSRIAEKKNLQFAVELMQTLNDEIGLSLDIYGPIEEQSYWNKCEPIIEKDKRINYKGVLAPHEIADTLQQYHFYILPTVHENYGHSIVEAIVSGVPIAISKNTPWLHLKEAGVGADLELNNQEAWLNYLKESLAMDQASYESMVQDCFHYAEENILNASAVEDSRRLFISTPLDMTTE